MKSSTQTLILARDYAAKLGKPFPKIDEDVLKEKGWPKACYVFKGKKKEPTIIYMPLFNRQNCKGLSNAHHIYRKTIITSDVIIGACLLGQMSTSSKQRWRSSPPSSFHSARRKLSFCWRR